MSKATEIEHETLDILYQLVEKYGDTTVEISFKDAVATLIAASKNIEYLNSPESSSFASSMSDPVIDKIISNNDAESLLLVLKIGGENSG